MGIFRHIFGSRKTPKFEKLEMEDLDFQDFDETLEYLEMEHLPLEISGKPEIPKSGLLDMPEKALDHIFGFLGLREICTLRKVNHALRDYLTLQNTHLNFRRFQFSAVLSNRWITVDQKLDLIYFQRENGVLTGIQGRNLKILEYQNFQKLALLDLEYFLKNYKNSGILEVLKFDWWIQNSEYIQNIDEIFDVFQKSLESRENCLKVQKLSFYAQNVPQILKILPFLDSEHLKTLEILDPDFGKSMCCQKIDKLIVLDQWNNLEEINFGICVDSGNLKDFGHFQTGKIVINDFIFEDLEILKKKFFANPEFQNFEIRCLNPSAQEIIIRTWETSPDGPKLISNISDFKKIRNFKNSEEIRIRESDSEFVITFEKL
ncbi:hypothetical protein B9Z55_027074 [Caenorhabditis nigoni]|nr:hypothetical protein B9Z55_027074 [Caenorhabditis nigoni]